MIRIAFYSGTRRGEVMRAEPRGQVFVLHTTKNGEPRHVPIHLKIRSTLWIYPIKISKGTVVAYWREPRRALGLMHLHLYLEHSAVSEMINAEIDLYTVGLVLGHEDARSRQQYAHLATTKTLAESVGRIGRRK